MEMQGSRHLAISQQQAWDALNDPQVLKACIAGCDKFEPAGDDRYTVGVALKIGPVAARFAGKVLLADVQPPNSYTIAFDGQGGAAGFGKGTARVKLSPPTEGGGCELDYTTTAQVGGKIAQVGQRLIDGVARSMAEDFFRRFDEEMQRRYPQAYAAEAALEQPQAEAPSGARKIPAWAWAVGAAVVLGALWLLLR